MSYFDKFDYIKPEQKSSSYFDKFKNIDSIEPKSFSNIGVGSENKASLNKKPPVTSYFDRFNEISKSEDRELSTQDYTDNAKADSSYFDKFKDDNEIVSTTLNDWGDFIKWGTRELSDKFLKEKLDNFFTADTVKLAGQGVAVGAAGVASNLIAGSTAFTKRAPSFSEFKNMPVKEKLDQLSQWTLSPFLPWKMLPQKTESQIDKALIAASDLMEKTIPREWSDNVQKKSEGKLSNLNTWVANFSQQIPLFITNALARVLGNATSVPMLGELYSYGAMSLIETGSFLTNPQVKDIDSSIREKWAARYGSISGGVEYAQELQRIGYFSDLIKDVPGYSIKGLLKASGLEGIEELTQDELQQAFTKMAILEHNSKYNDNISVPRINHKQSLRAATLGFGMGLTGASGGAAFNSLISETPNTSKSKRKQAIKKMADMRLKLRKRGYDIEQINSISTIWNAIINRRSEVTGESTEDIINKTFVSLKEPSIDETSEIFNQLVPYNRYKPEAQKAKQMLDANKSQREIWQTTGLSYNPVEDVFYKELDYDQLKISPNFYKNFDIVPTDFDSLSDIDQNILVDRLRYKYKEFPLTEKNVGVKNKDLVNDFVENFIDYEEASSPLKLNQVIEWDELFKSVPELNNWTIRAIIRNKKSPKDVGEADIHKKRISIVAKNIKHFRDILHHELTHAIASELMLEQGGNAKQFAKYRTDEERKFLYQLRKRLDKTEKDYLKLLKRKPQLENKISDILNGIRKSKKSVNKIADLLKELGGKITENEKFDYYHQLWGEVWARIASTRSKMPLEWRKKNPPISQSNWKKIKQGEFLFKNFQTPYIYKGIGRISQLNKRPKHIKLFVLDNKLLAVLKQKNKGAISFKDNGEVIFHALKGSDVSTAIHELGHLARRWGITSQEDIKTIEEWAGVQNKNWTVEQEEKFARAFERYMRTGTPPVRRLTSTFYKMKLWLRDIYKKISGSEIDVPISNKIRKVFDKMFLEPSKGEFFSDRMLNELKRKTTKITKNINTPKPNYNNIENADNENTIVNTNRAIEYFSRFSGLHRKIQRDLIRFEERRNDSAKLAAEKSFNLFKNLTMEEMEKLAVAIEMKEHILDPKLKAIEEQFLQQQEQARQVYERYGINLNWPDGRIDFLRKKIQKISNKKPSLNNEINEEHAEQVSSMLEEIEQLKGLRFVKRTVDKKREFLGAVFGKRPSITRKPAADIVAKRKFATREEAKNAGYKVKSILESHARYIHQAMLFKHNNELLDSIDKNKELSLPAKEAPSSWRVLDPNSYPKRSNRKYAPQIVDAFNELVNIKADNTAYDKLNKALKLIGFYNPLVMGKNDLMQGWRLSGTKYFTYIPQALSIWREKGHLYKTLKEYGLFNNALDYSPGAEFIAMDMYNEIQNKKGSKTVQWLKNTLEHPISKPLDTLQYFNNKYTWNMDEILRIAAYLSIKDGYFTKKYNKSDFEIAVISNDFMANYGKVPKKTRRNLNRLIYTPTYKISMGRVLAQMYSQPKMYWPQLFRHYSYKLFIWYSLPKLLAWWILGDPEKGKGEKGYKIILDTGYGKEKVYTLSDPLLEEAKLTQRPLLTSLDRNLAALPHALFSLIRPSFYAKLKKRGDKKATRYMRYFSNAFKLGAPVWREIETFSQKDLNKTEKILSALAVSYIYTRKKNATKKDKDIAGENFFKALSLWIDMSEQIEDLNRRIGIKEK
jgi:hypothetical protein